MSRQTNYKAGANRHWRAINSANQFWSNRPSLYNSHQILTAKDGRRYFLLNGKPNYLKGSQSTK